MSDVEAQACKVAHDTSSVTRSPQYVTWRERIRLFSWQWHAVVMATAVTSSIVHLFPYHNDSLGLKIVALVVFLIGLLVFTFDLVCIVAKAYLFPKECLELIRDPSKSSFAGFIAVGAAGLIDAGLNVNRDWNTGHNGFMYALWGFWWLDAALAYTIAFGVIFFILGQKSRDIAKVVPIWIIPVVALIASSTCGGLLGNALISHSHTMALVSSAFALTMCIIGLSFTTMITSSFLLRLFIHGVPEATTVLATFNTLTPLGQGGYSLLVNGENLSKLIPIQLGDDFPQSQLSGQMFYSICFCFAYILWCMGIAWSLVSIFSIGRRATKLPKFCVTHWCIVFPNGVFALLSVQIGNVLDSRFYKGFGAAWSIIVFILWTGLFIRSIPAFIDGTIFLSPVPRAPHKSRKKKSVRNEKHEPTHEHDHDDGSTLCDDAATIRHPSPDTPPTPTRSLTVPKSSVPLANPMQLVSKPSVSQPEPSAPSTLERPIPAELPATEHVTVHNTWSAKVQGIGPRKGLISRRSSRAVGLSQLVTTKP